MHTQRRQLRSRFSLRSFRSRILRAQPKPFSSIFTDWQFLVVLVILLPFTNWLGTRWIFERATLAGTDVLLREPKSVLAKHCTLITIDQQEFDTYLGEWLQPDKLASVLTNIIEYAPKVIVVDIDTSASRFRSMAIPASNSKAGSLKAGDSSAVNSKIVWARVSHESLKNNPDGTRSFVWQAGSVLGNRPDQPEFSGSPLFPQDADSTVRYFQRIVRTDAKDASLHWATLRALCESGDEDACKAVRNDNSNEDHKKLPFLTDWSFTTIPLSDLMGAEGSTPAHAGGLGDIVLLGASFSDIHPTSFGPKLGIELTASAIESELSPKSHPWQPNSEWTHWILKVLLAFAIAGLNNRLLPLWATTGTLLLIFLVFMASFLGIYYGVFRMDFLPFMIGIWIEQLIELSERAHQATQ